jgi:hypothetical protein
MRKIFYILVILITLILSSCVTIQKNVETPLITKNIYNANFSQYLEFNVNIKSYEINGTNYEMEIPSKKVYLSRNIIKENDSIFIKYTDEYNRAWKETVSKIYPEFQMLLWGGGDNNLSSNLNKDIVEVREGIENSTSNMVVNVVADFETDPDTIYNIYSINGNYYETQESPLDYNFEEDNSYDSEINSGDIQTLENYLFEMMSRSNETIKYLDIWNHGNGWIDESDYDDGYATYLIRQISIDEGNYNSSLKIKEITQLLKNFQVEFEDKIDVFGTDACYMAFIEIIYEFADEIDYYVGSVDLEPGDGWDYKFLKEFDGNLENLLKSQIDSYFEYYGDPENFITLSALKMKNSANISLKNYLKNEVISLSEIRNELTEDSTTISNPESFYIEYNYLLEYNYLELSYMLDLAIILEEPDDFFNNYIVHSKVYNDKNILDKSFKITDSTDEYSKKYREYTSKLSGIGISYRVNNNFLIDYMELQFYEDFINTGLWNFETYN